MNEVVAPTPHHPTTPTYHGLSTQDAILWLHIRHPEGPHPSEDVVRQWLSRGCITRTPDGRICPFSIEDYFVGIRTQDQPRNGDGTYAAKVA